LNIVEEQAVKSFWQRSDGGVAVPFTLILIGALMISGGALDYGRAIHMATILQATADSAALNVASADKAMWSDLVGHAHDEADQRSQSVGAEKVTLSGNWINTTDFQITASADVPFVLLVAVPGMPSKATVTASAVARTNTVANVSAPPSMAQLDPEAGDYNQIYVYCFDAGRAGDTDKGRSQMTLIADNGDSTYAFSMPTCKENESISYRLRNVRTNKKKWNDPKAEQYDYYTDTTFDSKGAQVYNTGYQIVETVLCDDLTECKPKSQGGILPSGKNRTPQTEKQVCEPGKFMYYGWEDRPPGLGWTDTDYDDIRVIVSCPTTVVKARNVRLIR
jgi:Flp pilus assembly protein TadG